MGRLVREPGGEVTQGAGPGQGDVRRHGQMGQPLRRCSCWDLVIECGWGRSEVSVPNDTSSLLSWMAVGVMGVMLRGKKLSSVGAC